MGVRAPFVAGGAAQLSAQPRLLDATRYHLGTEGFPEWQESVGKKPHGRLLEVRFAAQRDEAEQTLLIRQRDVTSQPACRAVAFV